MGLLKRKREPVYHFFSGKGGVGKTSIAAATALRFAREGKRTLIISVDPAHSLADSFDQTIGSEVTKIENNLFAVEIDPAKAVEEYKEKLSPQLEKMDALKGLGMEGMFDIAGMTPGIDEVAAFDKFLHYMHSTEWDVIIFDTAPTGHALRFLSLPDVLDSWVGKMIKIRMQFSGVINLFKKVLPFGEGGGEELGAEQLEGMKKRIEAAKVILTDPKKTHYNLVLIPEAMSLLESERSLATLREYNIPVDTIFVNQLLPENSQCHFCQEKRKQQAKRLQEITKAFRGLTIREVELFVREVRGRAMLEQVGNQLSEKAHRR